jgi:hypothetical protein
MRLRMSQAVTGVLRNVSVTREGAGASVRWFSSVQVQTPPHRRARSWRP